MGLAVCFRGLCFTIPLVQELPQIDSLPLSSLEFQGYSTQFAHLLPCNFEIQAYSPNFDSQLLCNLEIQGCGEAVRGIYPLIVEM